MKPLILFVGLISTNTFAFPTVGDRLTYETTVTRDSDGQVLSHGHCAVEFKSHDDANGRWNVETTCADNSGNEPVNHIVIYDNDDQLNLVKAAQVVKTCVADGHVKEVIQTPKGDFETCKIYSAGDQSTRWISPVPLTMVKEMNPGFWGATMTSDLIDFKIAP